ncbi:MAG: hypothetical protein KKB50_21390 [Planctomycetes bacterium]|nr:hypothetical protein [Planctomycetota bacterium]
MPRKHTRPPGRLRGKSGDDSDKVMRPILLPLDIARIVQVATDDILCDSSDDAQKAARDERRDHPLRFDDVPKHENLDKFFDYLKCDRVSSRLDSFRRELTAAGYVPQALLSRAKTNLAYRFLVRTIAELDPAEPDKQPKAQPKTPVTPASKPTARERYEANRRAAVRALEAFAGVLRPSCWSSYLRDRNLNRTRFLAHSKSGLRFPQAMCGFVWPHNLPTILVFDEQPNLLCPPFPVDCLVGGFEKRENVAPRRMIGVRLTWNQSRVVLLMDWREEDLAKADVEEENPKNIKDKAALKKALKKAIDNEALRDVKRVFQALDEASRGPDPDARKKAQIEAVKPLELAVRYFIGWLTTSNIDLSEAYADKSDKPAAMLVKDVCEAAVERGTRMAGRLLGNAVDAALELNPHEQGIPYTTVHWTNAEPFKPREKKYLGQTFGPRQILRFSSGDYVKYENNKPKPIKSGTPWFPLTPGPDGLVERCIGAQSLIWRMPILVSDLDDRLPAGERERMWRDMSVGRVGFETKSELMVPFFDKEEPLGVVNVESDHVKLEEAHLLRVEVVTHLFERVRRFFSSAGNADKKFVRDKLIKGPEVPLNAIDLLRRFSSWVRNKLNAQLSYLLIYDARSRVFVPLGVDLDPALAREFLEKEQAALGFSPQEGKGLIDLYETAGQQPQAGVPGETLSPVHMLLRHAAARLLIPRRRGYTWTVFSKNEPLLKPNIHKSRSLPGRKCVTTALGLPFRHDDKTHGEGVVWAAWKAPPAGIPEEALEDVPDDQLPPEVQRKLREFRDTSYEQVKDVLHVVAPMYTLHRYFDPERSTIPIPMRGADQE